MANLTTDEYGLTAYVLQIQKNFTDIDEETLAMSTFGYQGEIFKEVLQNAIVMASEYSNESIPIKAKFEKNVLAHALSLGINKINATPSYMSVNLAFPESALLENMSNDKFTFDKDIIISIGDYEFHTDYDIIITRNKLNSGEYTYTAIYDIDIENELSTIDSPYLPSVVTIKTDNDENLVLISCIIRQVEINKIYKTVLTENPMSSKVVNFSFDSQLASFYVEATEGDTTYHLTPVYDGLTDYDASYICNYTYMNANSIRIQFNKDSWYPSSNVDITIVVYTTEGESAIFEYNEDTIQQLESERFDYNNLYMVIKPITGADGGSNRKSITELKAIIPKEGLSRGNLASTSDLENFFNSLDTTNCKLYFYKKRDNQNERLYYTYMIMRDSSKRVIPTNTIAIDIKETDFDVDANDCLVMKPGKKMYYKKNTNAVILADGADVPTDGFIYICPYLLIVNKKSLFMSYYITSFNKNRFLDFTYINDNSKVQFIASTINWKRNYLTNSNKYTMSISLLQNIESDEELIVKDTETGEITTCNVKVFMILYNSETVPYRYIEATLDSYDDDNTIYNFTASLTTTDEIDSLNRIRIENSMDIKTTTESYGYFNQEVYAKIYVAAKFGSEYGRDDADKYIPGLDGYTLCNKYDVIDNISFYYNYSNLIDSPVTVNNTTPYTYTVQKVPVIGSSYVTSESKMQSIIDEMEKRRAYIDYTLETIEDSFGIDFKFFNTYGPSTLFKITEGQDIDRLNISLGFRAKPITTEDKYIKDNIIYDIKEYIENINEITDLHIPNLITKITNKYGEQLVYFEFLGINAYGPGYQHIYKPDTELQGTVPEFLNITTLSDGTPDITIDMV